MFCLKSTHFRWQCIYSIVLIRNTHSSYVYRNYTGSEVVIKTKYSILINTKVNLSNLRNSIASCTPFSTSPLFPWPAAFPHALPIFLHPVLPTSTTHKTYIPKSRCKLGTTVYLKYWKAYDYPFDEGFKHLMESFCDLYGQGKWMPH